MLVPGMGLSVGALSILDEFLDPVEARVAAVDAHAVVYAHHCVKPGGSQAIWATGIQER
jgi:hypothetical protein